MTNRIDVVLGRDGLYHGALFAESFSPSGAHRSRLAVSTTQGYRVAVDAIADISEAYPDAARPVDVRLPDLEDLPPLETGSMIEVVTPKDGSARYVSGACHPAIVGIEIFDRLRAAGRVELDSSSGSDPELSARYDTWRIVA